MYDIKAMMEQSKSIISSNQSKTSTNKIGISFLPEGIHTIRILPDSEYKFISEAYVHKPDPKGKYIQCAKGPNYNAPDDDCPICKAIAYANAQGVQLAYTNNRTIIRKMYFYLVDTNNKGDFWIPGKLYCVVVNKKVVNAFAQFLQILETITDPSKKELAYQLFDPSKETDAIQLSFSKGPQGNATITTNQFAKSPALKISDFTNDGSEVLPPLSTVYIDTTKPSSKEDLENGAKIIYDYVLSKSNSIPKPEVTAANVTPQVQVPQQPQVVQPQVAQPTPVVVPPMMSTPNAAPSQLPPDPTTVQVTEPNQVPWA